MPDSSARTKRCIFQSVMAVIAVVGLVGLIRDGNPWMGIVGVVVAAGLLAVWVDRL